MFEAGVNVGLGTDGAYVNCSVDMVEQMKFAALIQNVTHFDPTLMSAERVIEMATINTARAMGLDHLVPQHCTGIEAIATLYPRLPQQIVLSSVGTTFTFASP